MERLGPLDALFLNIEDGVSHMHIGACAVLKGPAPSYAEVRAIGARLDRAPRYRQVVRFVPFQLGRPVWVDDPHFSLEIQVHHAALPDPGGPRDLDALMGRLMSRELDRTRPLWESWMVEGLDGNRWALATKVHHCLVDGIAGIDLLAALFDAEPGAPDPPEQAPGPRSPSRRRPVSSPVPSRTYSPARPRRCGRSRGWSGRPDTPSAGSAS